MFLSVENFNAETRSRITGDDTCFHDAFNAFFDRGHVAVGNGAAEHFVLKFVIAFCQRHNTQMDFTKLTRTAGLLFMAIHCSSIFRDGFLVRYFGGLDQQVDLELGFSAADGHIDVLVTHALQNGLQGGSLVEPGQGHIFLTQPGERRTDLGGVGLGLGEDGYLKERMRIYRDRKGQRMASIAQGVAGAGFRQLGHGSNIAAVNIFYREIFNAARNIGGTNAFFHIVGRVPELRIGFDNAGIHAEVGLLTHKRIGSRLPHIGGQRAGIVLVESLFAGRSLSNTRGCVFGGGSQIHNTIQQALNADFG